MCVVQSNGPNGPYHNWPTSRGFERAYWYQGHSTDYFRPSELIDGVAPIEPPSRDDYFATDDLDSAEAKVSELGGAKHGGPIDIGIARLSIVADPQGAMFALYDGQLEP